VICLLNIYGNSTTSTSAICLWNYGFKPSTSIVWFYCRFLALVSLLMTARSIAWIDDSSENFQVLFNHYPIYQKCVNHVKRVLQQALILTSEVRIRWSQRAAACHYHHFNLMYISRWTNCFLKNITENSGINRDAFKHYVAPLKAWCLKKITLCSLRMLRLRILFNTAGFRLRFVLSYWDLFSTTWYRFRLRFVLSCFFRRQPGASGHPWLSSHPFLKCHMRCYNPCK